MTKTLIGATAIALGLSAFGAGCDDDEGADAFEDRMEERAESADERTVGDEMAEGEVVTAPVPDTSGDEMAGQGLATAEEPTRIGEEPRIGERIGEQQSNCAPGTAGAVGAATSIPADGSLREVVARVRRALEEEQLEVVHSQRLTARAPDGEAAGKPGEQWPSRAELILFTRTTDLEEALAVNPARALEEAKQLLVYESDGDVCIAFRGGEPGTQEYEPGYHGMGASKPGGMTTTEHAVDIESLAEAAARGEEQATETGTEQGQAQPGQAQRGQADQATEAATEQGQAAGESTMDEMAPPTEDELNEMESGMNEMENEPAEGEENPYRHDTNVDPEQGLR